MNEVKLCPNCNCTAELHRNCRGKVWYECTGCWTQTSKYWAVDEALIEWNIMQPRKRKDMWDDMVCPQCGFDVRDMIDGESEFRSWVYETGLPYCPNCGNKMEGIQ